MLCRMMGRKRKTGTVPVYLSVYDLTPINGYAYWLGLGFYHSGVQVHGVEYAFGAHEHSRTGIFEVEPKHCPGFTFRKSMLIGRSDLGPKEVRAFMETLAEEYSGNTYNLITKNCNHFCNDVCLRLTGKPIPRWVNRLARLVFLLVLGEWRSQNASMGTCKMFLYTDEWGIDNDKLGTLVYGAFEEFQYFLGLFCNCVLPAGLNETKVQHVRTEDRTSEKKKLRSHSSRSVSTSNPHRFTIASGSTTSSHGN